VKIGIDVARTGIAIAITNGSIDPGDAARSTDETSVCVTKIAGYYTAAILNLPSLPPDVMAILDRRLQERLRYDRTIGVG
jgi:hypothetical protein